jgi:hypothetical protein
MTNKLTCLVVSCWFLSYLDYNAGTQVMKTVSSDQGLLSIPTFSVALLSFFIMSHLFLYSAVSISFSFLYFLVRCNCQDRGGLIKAGKMSLTR